MLEHYPDEKSLDAPKSPKAAPKTPAKGGKSPATETAPAGPQFPRKQNKKSTPPAKILEPDEELPATQPKSDDRKYDEPSDSYEELPPAKSKVDPPELVNDPSAEEIERTKFDPQPARAKP
ncbi:MAG: hypothetical protein JWN70_5013 [Planctomycetaceae bacterium]|nr:hypothetical protein [Planctomycetaceae bacterium]